MHEELKLSPGLSRAISLRKGEVTIVTSPFYAVNTTFLAQLAGDLVWNDQAVLVIHNKAGDSETFNTSLLTATTHLHSNNRIHYWKARHYEWDVTRVGRGQRKILSETEMQIGRRLSNCMFPPWGNDNFKATCNKLLDSCNATMQAFHDVRISAVIIEDVSNVVAPLNDNSSTPICKKDIPWMLNQLRNPEVAIIGGCLSLDSATRTAYARHRSYLYRQLPGNVDHLYRMSGMIDLGGNAAAEEQRVRQYLSHLDVAADKQETIQMNYNHEYRRYTCPKRKNSN